LLPAWLTIGGPVARAPKREPRPSQRMPPWMRELKFVPEMGMLESSAVARMSGMQETAWQANIIIKGRTSVPSTESLNVWIQRNVAPGASLSWLVDQYPVVPDIIQPTARPMITEAERMSGAPMHSTTMMVTKTLKPSPINFGSPHGSGLGAEMSGHSA